MRYAFLLIVASMMLALIFGYTLISCNNEAEGGRKPDPNAKTVEGLDAEVNEFNIEGCQYLEFAYSFTNGHVVAMVHKGNCNNEFHNQ